MFNLAVIGWTLHAWHLSALGLIYYGKTGFRQITRFFSLISYGATRRLRLFPQTIEKLASNRVSLATIACLPLTMCLLVPPLVFAEGGNPFSVHAGSGQCLPWQALPRLIAVMSGQRVAPMVEQGLDDREKTAEHRLPPTMAEEVIDRVLAQPEFRTWKEEATWALKSKLPKRQSTASAQRFQPPTKLGNIIASFVEALVWLTGIAVLVLIIVYRRRWFELFQQSPKKDAAPEVPEILLGMDVRPQSLPLDIGGEANKLWQQGKQREALSLLYRGSLARLVMRNRLPLQPGHTEGDILALAYDQISRDTTEYLAHLTAAWQAAAYAHRPPDDAVGLALCEHWPQHFEIVS